MWHSQKTIIEPGRIIQYQILENKTILSYHQLLDRLGNNQDFRTFYNELLKSAEFEAFCWENPSLTLEEKDQPYEFVLIKSNALAKVKPEPDTFQEHYASNQSVVVFWNLGKNAQLIVPTPSKPNASFAHLANFVRTAPANQIDDFWRVTGETFLQALDTQRKWLSTAGLGVYWLHIRIDQRPKYYKYIPYKMA